MYLYRDYDDKDDKYLTMMKDEHHKEGTSTEIKHNSPLHEDETNPSVFHIVEEKRKLYDLITTNTELMNNINVQYNVSIINNISNITFETFKNYLPEEGKINEEMLIKILNGIYTFLNESEKITCGYK